MNVDKKKMQAALATVLKGFDGLNREEQRRLLGAVAILLGGRLEAFPTDDAIADGGT